MLGVYNIRVAAQALGFGGVSAKISKLQKDLNKLQKQKVMAGSAAAAAQERQTAALKNQLAYEKRIVALRKRSMNLFIGGAIGLGVSRSIGGRMNRLSATAAEFENTMDQALTKMGVGRGQGKGSISTVRKLGLSTEFTPLQAAEAFKQLGQMGVGQKRAEGMISQVLEFATAAGDLDPRQAAETLRGISTALGESDIQKISDMVIMVSDSSALAASEVTDMAKAFSAANMAGGRIKVPLEEILAMTAASRDQMHRANVASTNFANAMTRVFGSKSGDVQKLIGSFYDGSGKRKSAGRVLFEVNEALKKYSPEQQEAISQKIFQMRGSRQLTSVMAMQDEKTGLTGFQAYEAQLERLRSSGRIGETARKAARRRSTAKGVREIFAGIVASIEDIFGSSINRVLIPILKNVNITLGLFAQGLEALPGPVKTLIGGLMLAIPVFTGLASVIALVTAASGAFKLAMMGTNAVFLRTALIASGIAAKALLIVGAVGTLLITIPMILAMVVDTIAGLMDMLPGVSGQQDKYRIQFTKAMDEIKGAMDGNETLQTLKRAAAVSTDGLGSMAGSGAGGYNDNSNRVQKNNIKVEIQGNGDPDKIAKAIGIELDKRNGSMLNQAHKALVPNHGGC